MAETSLFTAVGCWNRIFRPPQPAGEMMQFESWNISQSIPQSDYTKLRDIDMLLSGVRYFDISVE